MSAKIIQQKYKNCGQNLPPEYFSDLAEFRKTPLGAAFSEYYKTLNSIAPKLGCANYQNLERAMDGIETEIAALLFEN